MASGRNQRNRAKQARRDARRRKARPEPAREVDPADEASLSDEVRQALDGGQPMDLLGLVSTVLLAISPQPAQPKAADAERQPSLDEIVSAFIDVPGPETTALLAVLGELLIDDDALRARCRRAVEERDQDLPEWLAGLAGTTVHRAVRMTHVLGDADELLLGVRLVDGQEMTCAANVDHLVTSGVKDAFFLSESIEHVLTVARASNDDPDTSFVELDVAEARAQLKHELEQLFSRMPLETSDTWPGCRALVWWLVELMPEGGTSPGRQRNSTTYSELLERFFASPSGMPYRRDHRALLEMAIDEGTGDPLRWSSPRLRQLLDEPEADGTEVQMELPELMRAFVPFAHAESGIRQGLTDEALSTIDDMADRYRATLVDEARLRGYDDPLPSG